MLNHKSAAPALDSAAAADCAPVSQIGRDNADCTSGPSLRPLSTEGAPRFGLGLCGRLSTWLIIDERFTLSPFKLCACPAP
jgi:hypothetical protein